MINIEGLPWWPSGRVFALHVGDRDSIPGRDRPKSFKEVIKAPLPSARQQVWVSRVLEDDDYKGLARVTVGIKSVEYRSKFVALHRYWWRFKMSAEFSSGTKTSKPPNKQINIEAVYLFYIVWENSGSNSDILEFQDFSNSIVDCFVEF